ncbi:RidA family protein [Viridibacillus sp. FSL R5-0468]|uniref:RidA family protein n=1 Tax=Viridibacillus sp. FSL R5-0468 TaxID=2921640 RepID=UPI0030FB1070
MKIEQRIEEIGIILPKASAAKALYVPVKQLGNALFVSGQAPFIDGKAAYTGRVGRERTLEEAQEASKICIINTLAAVKDYIGDLDRIVNVIKLQAFVNSETGFDQQHIVINSASDLLHDVFGNIGQHTRTAVGVNQLPMNITVEIDAIFEVQTQ